MMLRAVALAIHDDEERTFCGQASALLLWVLSARFFWLAMGVMLGCGLREFFA